MSTVAIVIAGTAVTTFAIKAAGPVLLGGRTLPAAVTGVIALLAPALLAALVVTQAFAEGDRLTVDAATAGIAAGGLAVWKTGSIVACVVVAAAVTAGLRAVT